MACPDGQYFCNEKQKCMPIPKGSKVRKDGELVSEVAPPGFGHTKGDKKKGIKKGGTAAAFDRARKEGRFKGSKSDMFAIMWAQKKKGAKPQYKPGTDKKYKKYQEESLSVKDSKKLNKAAVLSYSDDPKDQHRARVRQAEIDFKDLMRQRAKKKKAVSEEVKKGRGKRDQAELDRAQAYIKKHPNFGRERSKKDQAELDRAQAYIKKNPNFGKKKEDIKEEPERTDAYKAMQASLHPRGDAEGASAHKVMGWKKKGPKDLKTKRNRGYRKPAGARVHEAVLDATDKKKKKKEAELRRLLQHAIAVKKGHAESFEIDKSAHKIAQKKAKLRNLAKGNMNPNEKAAAEKKAGGPKLIGESYGDWKKKAAAAVKRVAGKKEERKAQKATDAGARAKRLLQRREYASKVSGSEDLVPDEMRD